ncbi:hypothetical protein EFBL_1635 [Effusibacillus lacus]|uniref:IucA/IucC family protein n=2 Tax=Effusibacillus lacus TaxID=1348429 RepID=A0A292YM85_9BACL|nr:hypothetical protein EFBL_1635 [Effusibacillus lacus]
MDEEELRILQFLEKQVPELVSPFVVSIPKGRQSIMNRLAASMLREDVLGLAANSYDLQVIDSIYALNVPAIHENWRNVIRNLHEFGLENGKFYKVFPLLEGECLVFPVSRTYAFRRLEVEGAVLHVRGDRVKRLQHAVELLQLIRLKEAAVNGETQSAWGRLAEELRNGSANLALAYAFHEQKKKSLRRTANEYEAETAIELILARKKQDGNFDVSLFFEQLCVEGHNLHPGAKTKIGMEPDSVYRYAPEFEGAPDIRFVGIRRDRAEWAVLEHEEKPNAVLFGEYPELRAAVASEFAKKGISADDYVFVPVHPWQLERAIPKIYKDEIERGIVVPVAGFSVPGWATSSFRTVVPRTDEGRVRLAIKVAVDSQMTSTVRSISANTTNNAPVFTRLIRTVMQREPQLAGTFVPVCEVAGFNFKVDAKEQDHEARTAKSRNLSTVLRENVESFVKPDELAIVGSALYAESPVTGKLILVELVEMYAKTSGEQSLRWAAFQFVSDYAAMALPGFLTLMVKYGIGLEGHLQNSVPVFRDGRPVRMLFRDWGGARICGKRLEEQGLHVNFYPGSVTVTDSVKEMRNKVFYTVFQNHIGEIILQICKCFGVPERELWQEIRRISDEVFDRLEADPEHAEKAIADKEALYQAEVDHKALTKMRLATEEKGYCYSTVPNPLHEFQLEKKEVLWRK